MIQLSTPPQILPAEGFPQGDGYAGSLTEDSLFLTGKNNSGIFAKLLETLHGKDKGEALPLKLAAQDEDAAGFPTPEEDDEDNSAWPISGHCAQAVAVNAVQADRRLDLQSPVRDFPAAAFNTEGIPGLFAQADLPVQSGYPDQALFNLKDGAFAELAELAELAGKKAGGDAALLSGRAERGGAATAAPAAVARPPAAEAPLPEAAYRHDLDSGEGERSLLAELRDRRERKHLKLEVRDLRTHGAANAAEVSRSVDAPPPLLPEIDIPVNLKPSPQLGDGWTARSSGREFSQSRLFEDALARELRGNLSADIVKNASLIIRNGGEGTIRLALNPASLGHVKIHLEMTENKILGHIIVESSEALRAFQKELPVLERAFKDSGFMESSLQMSLAQDGGEFGAGQQWREKNAPAVDAGMAASRYDARTELVDDSALLGSDASLLTVSAGRKTVNIFI